MLRDALWPNLTPKLDYHQHCKSPGHHPLHGFCATIETWETPSANHRLFRPRARPESHWFYTRFCWWRAPGFQSVWPTPDPLHPPDCPRRSPADRNLLMKPESFDSSWIYEPASAQKINHSSLLAAIPAEWPTSPAAATSSRCQPVRRATR